MYMKTYILEHTYIHVFFQEEEEEEEEDEAPEPEMLLIEWCKGPLKDSMPALALPLNAGTPITLNNSEALERAVRMHCNTL